jgi:hypothetical protein
MKILILIFLVFAACSNNKYEPQPEQIQEIQEIETVIEGNFNIFINNKGYEFEIHNISGTNYVNPNELAYALNGTEKQFDISNWVLGATEESGIRLSKSLPLGNNIELLTLNIDGRKYYRLRDLGRILNFALDWDSENNAISIDTSSSFMFAEETEPVHATVLADADGDFVDNWIISLDGVRQYFPLNAVLRRGRMYVDSADFSLALGLTMADGGEKHIFELAEEYGLLAYFHRGYGTLELFSGHTKPERLPVSGDGDAFIRLEDVIAANTPYHCHTLLKRRAIADLFYSHNAAFTIAWIPVNVRPSDNFRNDTRDYSRYNLEFVFTMDYLIDRGGQTGLHGYTHQLGNQSSVAGHEFGSGVSNERARELFALQIEAAEYFGWTVYSFTFPKYIGTIRQFEIAGEYFDFIMPNFHSRVNNIPNKVSVDGRDVVYMNAMQDHLMGEGETYLRALLNRLSRASGTASFFFHTWLEYGSIDVSRDDLNRPVISRDTNSPLHRILDNLRENGRTLKPTSYFF